MPEKVALIGTDFPSFENYCPNWVGMKDGLERLEIDYRFFTCRPQLRIDDLVEYAPDLVVYGLIDLVQRPGWRLEIRERLPNAKIVLWYGDYRSRQTGQSEANLAELDMMFVSNNAQNEWYERIWKVRKCAYLPLGAPIYSPAYVERLSFPFVFIGGRIIGQSFATRAGTIGRYEEKAGLKVIDGPSDRPDLREKVFRKMPSIYHSSKVVLDQSHFTDVDRYTSNRHWIITASNAFSLTKRFPGCELDYPEGTRAYFDTFEESLELLAYYLKNDAAREKIRAAGYEHAKNHTYDHRFRRMFELLYD